MAYSEAIGKFANKIEVFPSTLTAGTVYFAMRNTDATRKVSIDEINLVSSFIGVNASSRSIFSLARFNGGTPLGGTASTVVNFDNGKQNAAIGDSRFAAGGLTMSNAKTFTVNPATDIFTSTAHGFRNTDIVQLTTTVTLPAGLALATNYYVINATANTYQLSLTKNGAPVDATDTGTGTHTATYNITGSQIESYFHEFAVTNQLSFQAAIDLRFGNDDSELFVLQPYEGILIQAESTIVSGAGLAGSIYWHEVR